MYKYGQYCPVARATEILGDRWTLLIVRDLLGGTRHFNDLARGLPGISRGLLAKRLERLEAVGVLEKRAIDAGRKRTEYHLTRAGEELMPIVEALLRWGAGWAFGEPTPDELDPVLLLWWMRGRVRTEDLPQERVVVQFDFHGPKSGRYWMVLTEDDVSICLDYPGYDVNVLLTADLAIFYQVWMGRIDFHEAVREHGVEIDAIPPLRRAFPSWFKWSPVAPAVRAVSAEKSE